ncbi:SMC5-SMC6 complex localization factor protein 2 [Discoglossus pictus]
MQQMCTQDRPSSTPTAPMRNQSITQFFKPSQSSGSIFDSPTRVIICNESRKQSSSGAGSRVVKKRRKTLPVLSPSKSPIMEAFLHRGKKEPDSTVNGSSPLLNLHSEKKPCSDDDTNVSEYNNTVGKRKLNFSINRPNSLGSSSTGNLGVYKRKRGLKSASIAELVSSTLSQSTTKCSDLVVHPKVPECGGLLDQNTSIQSKGSPLNNNPLNTTNGIESIAFTSNSQSNNCTPSSSFSLSSNNSDNNLDTQATLSMQINYSRISSASSSTSGSELSSDSSSISVNEKKRHLKHRRKKCRYIFLESEDESPHVNLSSDEDEVLLSMEEILRMTKRKPPATPQPRRGLSQLSSSQSPVVKRPKSIVPSPAPYVNTLERILLEREENRRIDEMERKLQADIENGMQMLLFKEDSNNSDDGELPEEHRAFIDRFCVVYNAIPDENPGEEIFQLFVSGALFSQHTLDLRKLEHNAGGADENLLFSCDQRNQLMLATEGFLSYVYRFKECPAILMKWLFQMLSIHPSYLISVKILGTLIDLFYRNLASTSPENSSLWIPSLQDVISIFANMGVNFQKLSSNTSLRSTSCYNELASAMNAFVDKGCQKVQSEPVFTQVPEAQITNVIKFLGFCTAVYTQCFSDKEIIALLVVLFKIYLEKDLRQYPVVDLQCLQENLLQNIRDWETQMPALCLALSTLASHHHDFVKLVQLVPSECRGREVRKHLSLIIISRLLYEEPRPIPTDYDSQMTFLCQSLVDMKPSALVRKMRNAENDSKTPQELDQEAYYLAHSLLTLVNSTITCDENPSGQRKYLLQLCVALERHIKCDIREDVRFFYRTKVKDLIALIYGKWQELLHYSRPNQGKLYDYWEPECVNGDPVNENPNTSSTPEHCTNKDHVTEESQSE